MDVGRLSLLLRFTDLTKVVLDALANVRLKVSQTPSFLGAKKMTVLFQEPEYLLEARLIQAEYMVKSLGDAEQLYNKSSVDVRRISLSIRKARCSLGSSRHVFARLNSLKKHSNH